MVTISICPSGQEGTPFPVPWTSTSHTSLPHQLPDLAGEGTEEREVLVEQVQQPQELGIFVAKAPSKDNGADDVGSHGVEKEGGVLEGS